MYVTDDWENNYPKYLFEVWEILPDGTLKMIKDYETPMDEGMMLTMSDKETKKPIVLQKFSGLTRDDPVPEEARKFLNEYESKKGSHVYDFLAHSGEYSVCVEGNCYVYEEYFE